ncbi:hypothetical protein QWJ07_03835 [Frankia sp. RB7]|nr:hypothetical protein [Frankia sp. RB7]
MSYSIKFEMCANPWSAGLIVFDDGQAKLNRHLISPDRPVVVQLEGREPTHEQLEQCRHLWARLYQEMDFRVASFCPALLPHSRQILAPIVENIPA